MTFSSRRLVAAWAVVGTFLTAPLAAGPDEYQRIGLKCFLAQGGRVDWSPDGLWIAYDRRESTGHFAVHRIHPDGSGDECLTCNASTLPPLSHGQPAFSPDSRWLVFQAEKPHAGSSSAATEPGGGAYNDLWVLDLSTSEFTRLTDVRSGWPAGGSLHAHFSFDGQHLLWGDLLPSTGPTRFGTWRVVVADFVTVPTPHLENEVIYTPGDRRVWYETHGWSLDDREVLLTAAPVAGQDDLGMDIAWLDLTTQWLTRLTRSSGLTGEPLEWDEHAHLSPRGDAVCWMSSRGFPLTGTSDLRTELYIMAPDGSGQRRLTFFNEPGHGEYTGKQAIVSDNSWSPDGQAIAIYVQLWGARTSFEVWLLEFAPPPRPLHRRLQSR